MDWVGFFFQNCIAGTERNSGQGSRPGRFCYCQRNVEICSVFSQKEKNDAITGS